MNQRKWSILCPFRKKDNRYDFDFRITRYMGPGCLLFDPEFLFNPIKNGNAALIFYNNNIKTKINNSSFRKKTALSMLSPRLGTVREHVRSETPSDGRFYACAGLAPLDREDSLCCAGKAAEGKGSAVTVERTDAALFALRGWIAFPGGKRSSGMGRCVYCFSSTAP